MKVGTPVQVVDHEGYENILRVGEVGEAAAVTGETVSGIPRDGGKPRYQGHPVLFAVTPDVKLGLEAARIV